MPWMDKDCGDGVIGEDQVLGANEGRNRPSLSVWVGTALPGNAS
jgi:hypothetical protein